VLESSGTGRIVILLGCFALLMATPGCSSPTPPPIADAGAAQTVSVGQVVQLDGTKSLPERTEGQLRYEWAFEALPAGSAAVLNNAEVVNPSFLADAPGAYRIRLVVAEDHLGSDPAFVTITAEACGSAAPVIVAATAAPASPKVGDTVQLGAAVSDPDNAEPCRAGQSLDLRWAFEALPAGSLASLNDAAIDNPSFVADVPGDYVVSLVARDSTGRSSSAALTTVTVSECGSAIPTITTVEASPAAPNVDQPVSLNVAVADEDNTRCGLSQVLTVTSVFVGRPAGSTATLAPAEGLTPGFTPDVAGTYVVRVTVEDGTGRSWSRDSTVTATVCGDAAPTVTGIGSSPAAPNLGDLIALAVTVQDADNGGTCAQTQVLTTTSAFVGRPAGSTAELAPAVGLSPAFVADVAGTYIVRVTVADGTGRSSFRDGAVTVAGCGGNAPVALLAITSPVAAGPSADLASPNVDVGATVALDGSASSDADNACLAIPQQLSYRWYFVSKPAGSTATFNDAFLRDPSFIPDAAGAYRIGLQVGDGRLQSFAFLSVTADPTVGLGLATGYTAALVAAGPLFDNPEGLTVDSAGAVYVVQNGAGRVTRTLNGATTVFSRGAYLANIHDIAYSATSGFFVTSRTLNGIIRLDGTGLQTQWTNLNGAQNPTGIAVFRNAADQERLIVGTANGGGGNRVSFFNPAATPPAVAIGTEDFGGNLDNGVWGVAGTAIGGTTYYYAASQNQNEVWRTDGTADRSLSAQFDTPVDIALSASGKIVVADSALGMILLVENCGAGNCATTPIAWGTWQPWGLAFESATRLLATDRNGNTLLRIDGTF
jgi:hypothetical protein